MRESKLTIIIRTLSSDELIQLRQYLSSRFFNRRKELILLLNYIVKQNGLKRKNLSKESLFKATFGNLPFDYANLRHHMSYLFRAIEQFLTYEELHNNEVTEAIALCRSYRKRATPKLFEAAIKKTEKIIDASDKRNIDYHIAVYQLGIEAFTTRVLDKRSEATNLQEVNDQLDISYFAQKLRQACLMLAQQNVYNIKFDLGIIQSVIDEVEQKQLYNIPAIGIYYYTYMAQLDLDKAMVFKELQKRLVKNASLFDPVELGQSYLLAINIGIKLLNKGETNLMREILDLYKTGITSNVLVFNTRLSKFTYKNAITLAIRLKDYEWAKSFIQEYKPLLPDRFQEESYSYNLAHLYYAQKEYSKAMEILLITAKSDDIYVNLDTKVLLTRLYFEQSRIELLETQLNSFKSFIRRKSMIGYQKPHYQNFILAVNKLLRLNPFDKEEKQKLKKEIEALNPLPVKYWFMEQVTEH